MSQSAGSCLPSRGEQAQCGPDQSQDVPTHLRQQGSVLLSYDLGEQLCARERVDMELYCLQGMPLQCLLSCLSASRKIAARLGLPFSNYSKISTMDLADGYGVPECAL